MEPAALAEGVPPEPLDEDVAVLGSDVLPAEVVARIASFLCVRDLGRLACVARHFVRPAVSDCAVPGAMARLSIVGEGARLATLRHGATSGPPPPHAGSRAPFSPHTPCDRRLSDRLWMRYLWELEHPPPPPPAPPEEPFPLQLQMCGPASWTTITCHSCGSALGQGFNANCNCGRCPYPPMVPVRECACMGMGALLRPPSPPRAFSPLRARPLPLLERGGIELPCPSGDERYTVSPSCVFPAVDSSSIRSDPTALASRFRELGYLAFANFFSDDLTSPAADELAFVHHSRCASVGSDPVPADFEANLWSGASWSTELVETWRSLGTDATFARLKDEAALSGLVTALSAELGYAGSPSVLPQFTFVRGKGTGAGTTPHVDFRTSETTGAGLDKTQPGFICWVSLRVPTAPARHSELCFSPSSHQLVQDCSGGGRSRGKTGRGRGSRGGAAAEQGPQIESDVLPPEFRAKMEAGQAQWHVLNQESGLAGNGTLVLMDLQLVHGATIGATIGGTVSDTGLGGADELAAAGTGVEAYRYSWDTRFVCDSGAPSASTAVAKQPSEKGQCGPGQWTTVECHGCGAVLGRGFRSNCHCGGCPRPPMVPVRKCPCGGGKSAKLAPKSAKLAPRSSSVSSDSESSDGEYIATF